MRRSPVAFWRFGKVNNKEFLISQKARQRVQKIELTYHFGIAAFCSSANSVKTSSL